MPTDPHDRLLAINADAADFFSSDLGGSWVPNYLERRGLAPALDPDSPWQIGFAPAGWTTLTEHLRQAGYGDDTLQASGLATRARTGHLVDRFRNRLTLPIRDSRDRVIAFVARAHPDAGDQTPKYLNSPTTAIYRKGEHLLTTSLTSVKGRTPVVVEGPLDAIAVLLGSPDRHQPLALCGTALTAVQAQIVSSVAGGPGAPVIVATDSDDAGRAAACAAFRQLSRVGSVPWAADLPPGFDPAAVLETRGGKLRLWAGLTQSAHPLIDVVVDTVVADWSDRLRWVEGRVGVVRSLAPDLALLAPAQLDRQAQRLADLIGVEPGTVLQEVARSLSFPLTTPAPTHTPSNSPLARPAAVRGR